MKKVLLTAALVAFFGFANAQTEQGGWLVGGSTDLSFVSTSYDVPGADNDSRFNLNTKAGYFLMDNLAAGLNIGFLSEKDNFSSTLIGPFARYYFNGTFYAGLGYDIQSFKPDGGDSVSGGWLNIEAGYPFFVVDNVAFEPSLRYSLGSGDLNKDSSQFGLNVGVFLYF